MMRASRSLRGFTLVELMVVVATVSLLASVAVAEFSKSQLRSKAAERVTIMVAVGNAVNDMVQQRDGVADRVPGDAYIGIWNPPGVPGTSKRNFVWGLPGWQPLALVIQGSTYYSYYFEALDPAPRGTRPIMNVMAEGDLDGDGRSSWKTIHYEATGYAFHIDSENPPRGAEDWQSPWMTF